MKEYTPVKEGKVREIYDIGDCLIMVATDRISAFDGFIVTIIFFSSGKAVPLIQNPIASLLQHAPTIRNDKGLQKLYLISLFPRSDLQQGLDLFRPFFR